MSKIDITVQENSSLTDFLNKNPNCPNCNSSKEPSTKFFNIESHEIFINDFFYDIQDEIKICIITCKNCGYVRLCNL